MLQLVYAHTCAICADVQHVPLRPRLVWRIVWQDKPKFLAAFSDSSWAGCHDTRKSTSAACFMHGSHLVKAYSCTQSNIALSSGEAEFYGLVSTSSEALGLVAMSEDFGDKIDAFLYADTNAAIGVACRESLGRIRHLETQSLWLQQSLRQRRPGLGKVLGTENPSDLMTKHVDAKLLGEHVGCMGCEFVAGRAGLAPQVVQQFEDDAVGYVEDMSSGLMTASTGQESATCENHCALDSEVCLPLKFFDHRLVDDDCRVGDEASEGSLNRQLEHNHVDRDCIQRTSADEHLRGHP